MDLGAMAIKKLSAFLKAPVLLEPHHRIVLCRIQNIVGGVYSSEEKKSVCSTSPADWANIAWVKEEWSTPFLSALAQNETPLHPGFERSIKDQGKSGAIHGMELHPLLLLGVVAIEKRAFRYPSTKVAYIIFIYIYIYIYIWFVMIFCLYLTISPLHGQHLTQDQSLRGI